MSLGCFRDSGFIYIVGFLLFWDACIAVGQAVLYVYIRHDDSLPHVAVYSQYMLKRNDLLASFFFFVTVDG